MASESISTPTRRLALQDISVNVAVHKAAHGGGAHSPTVTKLTDIAKPRLLAEISRPEAPAAHPQHSPLRGEARMGGQKRVCDLVHDRHPGREAADYQGREGPAEGRRDEGGEAPRKKVKGVAEIAADVQQPDFGVQREKVAEGDVPIYEEDTPTSGLSPGSSLGFSQHGLNDTQITVVTEPDDARAGVIRGEELRQKARALKLRLSLAKYKIETNQIDTPMSQLRIKTSSEPTELPTIPRIANLPRTDPFSFKRLSNFPILKHRDRTHEYTRSFSSSPPPYIELESHDEPDDGPRESVSTPLLPRQRQRLLDPPSLGGDFEDRSPARELTSSVVKGRAAKGLLSLMGHQS